MGDTIQCSEGPSFAAKRPRHEKPSANALQSVKRSRNRTVSIAVCASMLENVKGDGGKHRLIAQVARAAAIFRVTEIVLIDDAFKNEGFTSSKDCNLFKLVLEYLECPQYLRKWFFPMCLELQHVGVAPPLDASHHSRVDDTPPYREGVVTRRTAGCSYVDVGQDKDVMVYESFPKGKRVTVRMADLRVVDRTEPRVEDGIYWGYQVRVATQLSQVVCECPYEDGYDLTVGTSERGESIYALDDLGKFRHLLIAFGGPKGIEHALEQDPALSEISDPGTLFNRYLNTCPAQGSRTIRTEEAILITMAALQRFFWV